MLSRQYEQPYEPVKQAELRGVVSPEGSVQWRRGRWGGRVGHRHRCSARACPWTSSATAAPTAPLPVLTGQARRRSAVRAFFSLAAFTGSEAVCRCLRWPSQVPLPVATWRFKDAEMPFGCGGSTAPASFFPCNNFLDCPSSGFYPNCRCCRCTPRGLIDAGYFDDPGDKSICPCPVVWGGGGDKRGTVSSNAHIRCLLVGVRINLHRATPVLSRNTREHLSKTCLCNQLRGGRDSKGDKFVLAAWYSRRGKGGHMGY